MTFVCTLYGDLIWVETTGSPACFNKTLANKRFCVLYDILVSY